MNHSEEGLRESKTPIDRAEEVLNKNFNEFKEHYVVYGDLLYAIELTIKDALAEQKKRHVEIVKNFRLETSRNVKLSGALRGYLTDNQKDIAQAIRSLKKEGKP